jgi:proline dehydrogenase
VAKNSKLDLNNLQIAFADKSSAELYQRLIMLSAMKYPLFTKWGPRLFNFGLRAKVPVTPLAKATLYKLFCGGETARKTVKVMEQLHARNVKTILDFASEGAFDETAFSRTEKETLENISFAAGHPQIAACVLKFTGICSPLVLEKIASGGTPSAGEAGEWQKARQRLELFCDAAAAAGVKFMIDAEESWIQGPIDQLCEEMMQKYNRKQPLVFTTLQMYRRDRLAYLKQLYQKAADEGFHVGIKLVRGAYLEKETLRARSQGYSPPLHESKQATDEAYDQAIVFCLDHLDRIALCAGTHNEASITLAAGIMEKRGTERTVRNLEFSQLLGMGDRLTYNLAAAGYQVSKYVPYGPVADLVPYLSRRMEENSAIRGQTTAELDTLKRELLRRRSEGALR